MKEKVSSGQMAALFLSFMAGSAIVNIPAPLTGAAKNGAWISVVIANGLAMLLLACVLYLNRRYPGLTFVDYSRKALGKWLSLFVIIPMLLLALVDIPYIVIDIGGFFKSTMMRGTPVYITHTLVFLTAALTARAGIEVMARMFVLLLFVIIVFVILVLLFVSPYYHVENLLPLGTVELKSVMHGTYIVFGFPFAELVTFSMLLPLVSKESEHSLNKYMFIALLSIGILLIASIVCSIMALGPLAGELKFSLFQLARLINVQEIIERVESVIGMVLIVGSYMKTTIMLFILNKMLSHVLKFNDARSVIFPVTLVTLLLSLTMYKNEAEFAEAVNVVWPLFTIIAVVLPLVLVTVVTLFKGKND
ncbi:endospore germination permease [Paenibacillus sp. LHD-38]|uniref:GerAB/ArcD/ProY family transporter n=1 Tax=Paenibacillus sp. LHD-38 TaxID=3072143 RepID=UPI00280DE980|nr:endospore germination permease [Paenibacillus sp. LHD-38]MDQ8733523.1 endospore germination permease [Paenibacillus sp. LHD-38]